MTDEAPVDREKLFALVAEKTPFSKKQFERLLGYEFGDTAPVEMKRLARDLIELPRADQDKLKEIQLFIPGAVITRIGPIAASESDSPA